MFYHLIWHFRIASVPNCDALWANERPCDGSTDRHYGTLSCLSLARREPSREVARGEERSAVKASFLTASSFAGPHRSLCHLSPVLERRLVGSQGLRWQSHRDLCVLQLSPVIFSSLTFLSPPVNARQGTGAHFDSHSLSSSTPHGKRITVSRSFLAQQSLDVQVDRQVEIEVESHSPDHRHTAQWSVADGESAESPYGEKDGAVELSRYG